MRESNLSLSLSLFLSRTHMQSGFFDRGFRDYDVVGEALRRVAFWVDDDWLSGADCEQGPG